MGCLFGGLVMIVGTVIALGSLYFMVTTHEQSVMWVSILGIVLGWGVWKLGKQLW